jgi:hypothetical protein
MSTFTWIDHSERQRRQILEAIDLFKEKDTRDELGIAVVRDTFADLLFPGTGSLQTRARYFFFVPWMYRRFEEKGTSSAAIVKAVREFEIRLIDTLADSEDNRGTIGILARASLQRVPSSIYWNGLKTLGICRFDGAQAEYHRAFERINDERRRAARNDDGEIVGSRPPVWAPMPAPPADFPNAAAFKLRQEDATYLKERIIEHDPGSMLAWLVQQAHDPFDEAFLWEHPVTNELPVHLHRQVEHARNFSECMFGAPILYNLILAEMQPLREDVRENCLELMDEWRAMMAARTEAHRRWERHDFWNLMREAGTVPSGPTQWFVEAWIDIVLDIDLARLPSHQQARDLVAKREHAIKGALARCFNPRAREVWRGDAGLTRIDYRWRNASDILHDIFVGLGELDA